MKRPGKRSRSVTIGIDRQRLLVTQDCLLHRSASEPVPEERSLQVGNVRCGIDSSLGSQSRAFLGRHLNTNLASDRVRDLALQRDDVSETTLVALRPQAPIVCDVHQLHCYTHSVADPKHMLMSVNPYLILENIFRTMWQMHCRYSMRS